ncbi:hypothetical protein Tel_04305 [Candidatus Tenderia electrophaga]|jgi:phosphatidylserine/phosphatidylglycerophosphate/cardiolipin synthase-like enzyme|uniref:PLD phosphodiesterase domain-containing protein n=1 Tax=Candidatus Tenderia electrophaga TaxID=1748243 RepID=A0A0S2TBA6_9GAMM|nr:hypothetical protein Tel_04305 [Candidatus Tenderia electrophaga]
MRKTKIAAVIVLGVLAGWVIFNTLFDFYGGRPETPTQLMQLDSYDEGMSLREVFETFPAYGAGRADLRLLNDNNLAWAARWDLLDKARQSIDVSYFILKQDVFGIAFLSHLLKKAKEGVKVRILLDAYGSRLSWDLEGNDYLDALVNTGNVEIRMYRPLYDRVLQGIIHLSVAVAVASEHDKILVVDGKRAITGGRNIAKEYFSHPADAEMVFRDVEVEVSDQGAAQALTTAFETQFLSDGAEPVSSEILNLNTQKADLNRAYQAMDSWLRGEGQGRVKEIVSEAHEWREEMLAMAHLEGNLSTPLPPYLNAEIRVLDSAARFGMPGDAISLAGTRLVNSAREEIFIQNPYVMVSEETLGVFAQASKNGVPITLFTNSPEASESIVSQAFFLEQWPYILSAVPTLKLYANDDKQMVHAKLASFDNIVSLIGTYNLSPLSMATNSEIVIAVWSREFSRRLTQRPRKQLDQGRPGVYQYRIQRHPDGSAMVNEEGAPVVAFGPKDHIDMEDNEKNKFVLGVIKSVGAAAGVSPFF